MPHLGKVNVGDRHSGEISLRYWKRCRPVGTRTPDLYRVKAAWLCTANNFKGVGYYL